MRFVVLNLQKTAVSLKFTAVLRESRVQISCARLKI